MADVTAGQDKLYQTLRDAAARIGHPDLSAATELVALRAENTTIKAERSQFLMLLVAALREHGEFRVAQGVQPKGSIVVTDDPVTGELVVRLKG